MIYFFTLLAEIFLLFILSRSLSSNAYSLLLTLTKNKNYTNYFFALLFLPGTILHEASHAVVSILLRVPVGKFELIPEARKDGIKLGSVEIQKTDPIRRFLIGIAPLLVGFVAIMLAVYFPLKHDLFNNFYIVLLVLYALFEIGNTMFSSKSDMEGSYKIVVILVAIYILFYFLKIDISFSRFFQLYSSIFKSASLYLLPTIIIDIVLVVILDVVLSKRKTAS